MVEAIYRHGIFEPLAPVNLPEEQRVHLSIEPAGKSLPPEWLMGVNELHNSIIQRQGCLPDSTADIAEDRRR